ncbi:MAG: phage holin family protein [Pseudorhodobacter sp.]
MSILDLLIRVMRLFNGELRLAQAELAQAWRRAVIALLVLVVSLVFLAQAIGLYTNVIADFIVSQGLTTMQASLILAVVYTLIASVLAFFALRRLHPRNIIPRRTLAGIKRDLAVMAGDDES